MPQAVGIDLGTTFSAAAWLRPDGRTEMIPTRAGGILTPSAVLFGDAYIVVGEEALSRAAEGQADRLAQWVKRDVGKPLFSRPILGQQLPPEAIQACILRQIQADVERRLGGRFAAVITVPAYFDEPRRRSTMEAGQMAGLEVLDIVNEPTAAALAFGERIGYLNTGWNTGVAMRAMVFDLGGGTFDVTLMDVEPNSFRTLATDGDARLGGFDWDQRLVDFAAERFIRLHRADPRQSATGLFQLHVEAERVKRLLSSQLEATMLVECGGVKLEISIARAQFEELTADLLSRTNHTTRALLATAGSAWRDVSRLLLVGGATRMPMVYRMLQEMSGILPDHCVHPDEAVARGAAIYAGRALSGKNQAVVKLDCLITDVNSHSLGVQGVEVETGRRINRILLPKNTPLPARITKRFITTKPGQRSLAVQILEGESRMPRECTVVGTTIVRNLPPHLPQGSPVNITFQYATNGRLEIFVDVPGTTCRARLELESNGARDQKEVARWRQVLADHGNLPAVAAAAAGTASDSA